MKIFYYYKPFYIKIYANILIIIKKSNSNNIKIRIIYWFLFDCELYFKERNNSISLYFFSLIYIENHFFLNRCKQMYYFYTECVNISKLKFDFLTFQMAPSLKMLSNVP
jgi:hypothetical protein